MIKKVFFLLVLINFLSFCQEKNNSLYFNAAIGKNNTFRVKLDTGNSEIHGVFYYSDSGKKVELTGTFSGNMFTLKNKSIKTLPTEINGRLVNEKSSVSCKFENPLNVKCSLEAKGNTIRGKDFNIFVYYPELINKKNKITPSLNNILYVLSGEELKTNYEEGKTISTGVVDEIKNDIKQRYTWETNLYIENWSKNIFSVSKLSSKYFGGAAPDYYYTAVNINLQKPGFPKIMLADIFNKESNFEKILSDMIIDELKAMKASLVLNGTIPDLLLDVKNSYLTFVILQEGLRFDFGPSVVGSTKEGAFHVFIPYRKIKDIINTKGVLKEYKIR